MNEPISKPIADPDIGPLDEDGQQIWSPEEEAAIARLRARPWYQRDIEEAEADEAAGNFLTQAEVTASLREVKRKWFAAKGIAPPPGYFDN